MFPPEAHHVPQALSAIMRLHFKPEEGSSMSGFS